MIYTDYKKGSDLFVIKRNYDKETYEKHKKIVAAKFANDRPPQVVYEDDFCKATKAQPR